MSATSPSVVSGTSAATVRGTEASTQRRGWRSALVPLFFTVQILMVLAVTGREHPPPAPSLGRFPTAFGPWRVLQTDPIDEAVAKELGADRLVSQTYVRTPPVAESPEARPAVARGSRESRGIGDPPYRQAETPAPLEASTGAFANLLVAWFQTQREGARQPHSPKVCLPGAGWTAQIADRVTVGTAVGAITVNRYVVEKDKQRAVILYWYQTPRRVIAGEWAAKFWLAADGLRDRRTDTALVRVTASADSGGDQAATEVAAGFARDLYPALREYLPR
jgi:EpsI family protein